MDLSDVQRIEVFIARAEELHRRRLVREGFTSGISFRWEQAAPLRIESQEPDQDDLQSLMVALRPFFLKDDAVYLERVLRIGIRLLRQDEFRHYLEHAREKWRLAAATGHVRLEVSGREIGARELADMWMNGYYFHTDLEIQSFLSRLWPQQLIRQRFIWFLSDAVQMVLYTANLLLIARREGFLAAA